MPSEELIASYRVAELATVDRGGAPVCWPLTPETQGGRIVFSTGYLYPAKARNARRRPRVAALFSDPTASGRGDDDPFVLVQGLAEVHDDDLQRNAERYVDQIRRRGPFAFRLAVRLPPVRRAMAGYLVRIFIELVPERVLVWPRNAMVPREIGTAVTPDAFVPAPPIALPPTVAAWMRRYARPPVLSYIAEDGWPAATRVVATVRGERIALERGPAASSGAPACLTYHRLVGNYRANAAFLIRGHLDAGGFVPEKVVGFTGTADDRGLGSLKILGVVRDLTRRLPAQLERDGRPPVRL